MSRCPDPSLFNEYVRELNMVNVEGTPEKNFRYNLFAVDAEDINTAIRSGSADLLPGITKAKPILKNVRKALSRASDGYGKLDPAHKSIVKKFRDDFVGKGKKANENAALMSIAMLELIDATKGDVDKARKYGIDTKGTLIGNTVPAVPLSRLAASIGRKSMFTYGLRFQSTKSDPKSASEIESLYYVEGLIGLELLQEAGYVDFHSGQTTIQDYKNNNSADEEYAPAKLVDNVRSVALNTSVLGIKNTTADGVEAQETAHFTDRASSDLKGTALGVIVDTLSAIRNVTQPSNDVAPHTVKNPKSLPLSRNDPYDNVQSTSTESARQKLYDSALYVGKGVHKFVSSLSKLTGDVNQKSASEFLRALHAKTPLLFNSVYGIQTSNAHNVDSNESISGQNKSKTTPIDDLVDSYSILTDADGNPIGLHMELKGGRNQRLYYNNTILNPHASKASRHTLTSGEQTVEMKTEDFNMLVYVMKENLSYKGMTFDHITKGGNTDLEAALKIYNNYTKSTNDRSVVQFVNNMAERFPGVDYAQLLTTLSGITDVRKAIAAGDTHVTTEFMVSTDATAQGGNLTLQQSLGTEQTAKLTEYFTRIGLFNDVDNRVSSDTNDKGDLSPLADIYGLMTEGTKNYLGEESTIATISVDPVKGQPKVNVKALLQSTLDLLFGNDPKGERDLAKNSTLPFIYNQGKNGAISSMSESVAKQVMGTLDTAETRQYLSQILGDSSYSSTVGKASTGAETVYTKTDKEIFDEKGLYVKVKDGIKKSGVPEQLYFILESEVNDQYLVEYKKDSDDVIALAKKVKNSHRMKVLPLAAVLDNETDIKKFGMTLSKIIEVAVEVDVGNGETHTVLTRKQELTQSIMDVSVTHGMDSGLLYKAIDMVMAEGWTGGGGVVVHDQLIGSVELVRKVEAQYVTLNARLMSEYDVHSQVMDSIALYDPEVAKLDSFKTLNAKLKKRLAAKKAIAFSDLIDLETDALIGDKGKIAKFAAGQETNKPTVVPAKENKLKKEKADNDKAKADDVAAVGVKREELKVAFRDNPDDVFTYDFETSGLEDDSINVQYAYKRGDQKTQVQKVYLTKKDAAAYLQAFLPDLDGDVDSEASKKAIFDSKVYQDIKASYRDSANGMSTWNKDSIKSGDIKADLAVKSAGAKYVVSYNGINFDDKRSGLTTTHDLIRLVRGTVGSKLTGPGKLTDFVENASNAHSADADVDMTVEVAKHFVEGTLVNRSPKLEANKAKAKSEKNKSSKKSLNSGPVTDTKSGTSNGGKLGFDFERGVDYSLDRKSMLDIYEGDEAAVDRAYDEEKNRLTQKGLESMLEDLRKSSPLLDKFLNGAGNILADGGEYYNDATNTISITGINPWTGKPLDISKEADRKQQIVVVEHEVTHSYTAAYIQDALNKGLTGSEYSDVSAAMKAADKLVEMNSKGLFKDKLSEQAQSRVDYISGVSEGYTRLAEFLSVMSAEHDSANEVYDALTGKGKGSTLKTTISRILSKIKEILLSTPPKKLEGLLDVDATKKAIAAVLANGMTFKEQKYQAYSKQKKSSSDNDMNFFNGPKTKLEQEATVRYLNYAVASMLNSQVQSNGKAVAIALNNVAKRFPLYDKAIKSLSDAYDESSALQQLVNAITGGGTDKFIKAELLAGSAKVDSDQKSSIGHQQGEFKKALEGVSAETRHTIGRFVKQMPLHDYFIRLGGFDTAAKIDAEVKRLEAEISLVGDSGIRNVNNLIDRNVKRTTETKEGELLGGNSYNLYQYGDDKHGLDVKALLALKSIQAIGTKEFEEFLANTDLVNLIKDNVVANRLTLMKVGGTESLKDSLIPDYWKETNVTLPVTLKDVNRYINGENNGWKLLREPTKTELGIVYRQLIDSTDLKGAQTDLQLKTDDVDVTNDYHKKFTNVVQSGMDSFKLVFTPLEKQTLGVEEDFVDSLIRGTAHSMAVSDSQYIRDAIVASENRFDGTDKEKLESLETYLKSSNVDAPYFVKTAPGYIYDSLPDAVKAKYKSVGKRASDVVGESGLKFSDEVHLVRKDMAHFLIGDHAASPINYKPAKWALRTVKNLTAMTKIRMVVTNPGKIASDNLSNLSYLSVAGASPLFIAKNYQEIARDYHDYQNLLHKTIQLKVKLVAQPDNEAIKAQLDKLNKQIAANPVGDLEQKGFINSLGSDLVARSSDVSSGLQADMETALTYMLKNEKGNNNFVGQFIMNLSRIGFDTEDYVKHLGNIVGQAKDGRAVEQQLDLAVQRIKDIKSDNDVVAYVSQYTTSPGSELVRMGSSMTDLTDVLAKETLYRHAMQNEGMSAKDARIHVLDSFPDYKENLPMAVKQLSDVGVLMFPSFWLRIQKSIYRMAKDKPASLGTELLIEAYVTGNMNTIFDSNFISKFNSFGGYIHTPLGSTDASIVFPTNIFNL